MRGEDYLMVMVMPMKPERKRYERNQRLSLEVPNLVQSSFISPVAMLTRIIIGNPTIAKYKFSSKTLHMAIAYQTEKLFLYGGTYLCTLPMRIGEN